MIRKPIKGFIPKLYPNGSITQFFGENVELYKVVPGLIKGHNGIDIVAAYGTPLYSVEDGLVVDVKDSADGYGKHIRILSNGKEWTYGHLAEIYVKVGDKVTTECIGLMGNTGFVVSGATPFWKHNPYAGTHLHLGLRLYKDDVSGWAYPVGPKIKILDYTNGSLGSIDFLHLFDTSTQDRTETLISLRSALNHLLILWGLK